MIRHATLLIVLILAPLAGCARTQPLVRLTVLTYNIHHGEGMDKKLDLERIAGVIRSSGADLVALQEVDLGTKRVNGLDEPAELARLTNMHVYFGPAMDFDGGKYGDAVLSRYPIPDRDVARLPFREGDKREPRVVVAATCQTPGGGLVVFISTHWDHTPEPSDRLAQAKATNEHFAGIKHPAIIAGDFNCPPESPPMLELLKRWQLVSGGELSAPANRPRISIDHVLVNPQAQWKVIETKVIDEPVASDHRPVMVTIEFRRSPRLRRGL